MQLTGFEYGIVGVYILAILGVGAWFSRKGSANVDEYFLGGKSLPWWVLGISFMTSNLDLTGTMVIASFFALVGLKGFLVEMRGGTALAMAIFMIFMAKWHRRAAVMTVAEWMEVRFGSDRGARLARIVAALGVVVLVIGMLAYFCVGFGKFLTLFFPWDANTCALIFTVIATVHILFSGLYGVAFTDVLQGVMILFVVGFIAVKAFLLNLDPVVIQQGWAALGQDSMTWAEWTSVAPSWQMTFPPGYEAYDAFGFLLVFWVLRIFMEGFGGPLVPYSSQRFFAARDGREASLTTGFSMALFVVRWPLIIGVAVLGLGLGADFPSDPEMVFPAVLGHYFPAGLRAVVVSCMVAAAMSTFDSTVNAGGAYIVNDIYRRFIKPDASEKALMRLSWAATIGLTVICLFLATFMTSINEIWSWISMGLFGGMAVPFVLRWYWERFNGWGYAIGTIVGISSALIQKVAWPELGEAWQLITISSVSLLASLLATWATPPTEEATRRDFYRRTRPLGWWPIATSALSPDEQTATRRENRRDLLSVLPALGFFFFFFLAPMYAVIHDYPAALASTAAALACAVVLYFSWFRHLRE